jgi:hypothetical protein
VITKDNIVSAVQIYSDRIPKQTLAVPDFENRELSKGLSSRLLNDAINGGGEGIIILH